MAVETPSKSAAAAAATATQAPDASDNPTAKAASGIFSGLRFYISRAVAPDRRGDVRNLIKNNEGTVVTQEGNGAVTLVDSESLRADEEWVSVDFIFDSVRDGVLRDIHEYSARQISRDVAMVTTMTMASKERSVATTRRGRMSYTVAEQADMFRFLERHFGKLPKSMIDVPLSVWEIAARQGVTKHPASSMHTHYNGTMKKLTPMGRRNVFQNAEGEANAKKRTELARANYLAERSAASDASAPPPAAEDTERTALDAPTATTSTPPADNNERSPAKSEADARNAGARDPVREESREVDGGDKSDEDSEAPERKPASTSPPLARRSSRAAAPDAPAVFSEANFTSRWELLASDSSRREFLQQCFHPVRPSAAAPPATREPAAAGGTGGGAASRRRRRAEPAVVAAAEQRQQRAEPEEEKTQEEAPRKRRKARQHAATFRPPAAVARAAPQDAESSEMEITHVVSQLQLETNQDADAVVNALFYACGDVAVAKAFLRGASPSGVWSHADDVLLEELVDAAADARAVAAARQRGAFAAMRVRRSVPQILARVRYLSS